VPVGVVIPAYRAEAFIAATLHSVRAQSDPRWRCVVIDDGSPDGTGRVARHVAAGDARIEVLSVANGGVSRARNLGLDAMPAEINRLLFLDADDLLHPTALARLGARLDVRPDAVGAFGLADYVDAAGALLQPGEHPARQLDRRRAAGWRLFPVSRGADLTFDDMIVYNPVWPPAVALVDRKAVERVGGFDAELAPREDWDLFLRLTRYAPMAMLDEIVAYYRMHGDNATGNDLFGRLQGERVRRKAFDDASNSDQQRRTGGRVGRRLRLAEVSYALRHCYQAARRNELGGVGRGLAGGAWTAATLLSSRPPAPNARRHGWTHDVGPTTVWHPQQDRIKPVAVRP